MTSPWRAEQSTSASSNHPYYLDPALLHGNQRPIDRYGPPDDEGDGGSRLLLLLATIVAIGVVPIGLILNDADLALDDLVDDGPDVLAQDAEAGQSGQSEQADPEESEPVTAEPRQAEAATDEGAAVEPGAIVPVAAMTTGLCFDYTEPDRGEVGEVRAQSCDRPHDGEVVGVVDHPDAGGRYPGETELDEFTSASCPDAFNAYVDTSTEYITVLQASGIYPLAEDWADGMTYVICRAERWDGDPLTLSVEGQGANDVVALNSGEETGLWRLFERDCFRAGDGLDPGDLGQAVAWVVCEEGHNGEVTGFVDLSAPFGAAFEEAEVRSEADLACGPVTDRYLGGARGTGAEPVSVLPDAEDWTANVRFAVCVITKADGSTGSLAAG